MFLLSANTMRLFLGLTVLGMSLLAVFFLCGRRLSLLEYLGWGLLAVALPLVGPFLVIVLAPGEPLPKVTVRARQRQRQWRALTRRLRRRLENLPRLHGQIL